MHRQVHLPYGAALSSHCGFSSDRRLPAIPGSFRFTRNVLLSPLVCSAITAVLPLLRSAMVKPKRPSAVRADMTRNLPKVFYPLRCGRLLPTRFRSVP
jgi:hypothetical protein